MKELLFLIMCSFAFVSYGQSETQDYEFTYEILEFEHSEDKKNFGVALFEFEIINHSEDTLFYFSSTCDGDAYLIEVNNKYAYVEPWMYCNASYPCANRVLPDSSEKFKYQVIMEKKVKTIQFEFVLDKVKANYRTVDGKSLGKCYRFEPVGFQESSVVDEQLRLRGQVVKLP